MPKKIKEINEECIRILKNSAENVVMDAGGLSDHIRPPRPTHSDLTEAIREATDRLKQAEGPPG